MKDKNKGPAAKKAESSTRSKVKVEGKESQRSVGLDSYLEHWATDRESWKFNKVLQTFALEHVWDKEKIDKSLFRKLLPYLGSIQGGARDRLLQRAQEVIDGDNQEEGILKRAIKVRSTLTATAHSADDSAEVD